METGISNTTTVTQKGNSSKLISGYAQGDITHPIKSSSAGLKINISKFTLDGSIGLDKIGVTGSWANGNWCPLGNYMFGTIRIIFWGIIFVIVILMLKKKKRLEKKNVSIAVIVVLLLGTLSVFFPVENYFFTFSTPEKAFNYINSEEVRLVVEGQESALVIAEEAKADYVHLVIPKWSNGWKLGRGIDTKLKSQMMDKEIVINLYQYRESGEYYVTILDMSEEKLEIIDSCDSTFVTFDDDSNKGFKFYFAYLSLYDENYWIKINNHKHTFVE